MYVKKGIPYNIVSDDGYTGNSFITMSDIIANDIIMEAIFNNKSREQIKGLETEPVSRELCESVLDNIKSDEVEYSIDKIIDIDAIYTSSIQSLDREFNVDEVTLQGCEFIVDDYGSSFTVIKVVTYENIEGNELNQVHYLLPLFHHDVVLANKVTYALHVSGNGECEFLRLPMIESGDTYAIDSRELVNKLLETKAYSMWFMNLIQHKKLLVVPKEDFAVQLARLGIVNFIPAQGLGVYLDGQNKTLMGNIVDNNIRLQKFDVDEINNSKDMIVVYDNRSYNENLLNHRLPISISILDEGQVMYAGMYMDDTFIEIADNRMKYMEADTSTKVGRAVEKAKRIPRQIVEKGEKLISELRGFMVEWRKAKDDALREKVINDEFIPILDNSMQWLVGAATGFGIYFLVTANPLIAILGGYGAKVVKGVHDAKTRERVLKMIKDELEIIDEKINDAKNSDDRKKKYALMRIKQSLEKKLLGIVRTKKYV